MPWTSRSSICSTPPASAAAKGKMVTVRTFDFGADRTMADAYQGVQSSKLGLRGIRSSLRNMPQMAVQICASCVPPQKARCGSCSPW